MPKEYKRKFQVPGNTIKACWNFRKKCEKKFGYNKPCYVKQATTRVTSTGHKWITRKDESLCPFPVNKPNKYIVSETLDGEWQCSCPAWKFRRKQCHHIRKAQQNPEKYEIAKEFTGKTTDVFTKIFEG